MSRKLRRKFGGTKIGIEACLCDAGFVRSNSNASFCEACPENFYEKNGVCVSCGVNAISPQASTDELNCTCNTTKCHRNVWHDACEGVCRAHGYECTECQPGHFKSEISSMTVESKCLQCSHGKYQPLFAQDSCISCNAFETTLQMGSVNETDCVCVAGFELVDGICRACQPGFFKSDAGDFMCTRCAIGSFADGNASIQCTTCDNSSAPINAHTTENTGSTHVDHCVCDRGFFLDNNTECLPCVRGSFKDQKGNQICLFCGGHHSNDHSTITHTYGANETGAIDSSHCLDCPLHSGYDADLIGTDYVMNDITKCLCYPGFTNFDESNGCSTCDDYHFKLGYSNNACSLCSANEYWVSTTSVCNLCQLFDADESEHNNVYNSLNGSYNWGTSFADCSCNLGFYQSMQANHSVYTFTTEATCHQCEAGTFRDSFVYKYCDDCAYDDYQPLTGQTECLDCPAHSFTNYTGAQSIQNCRCEAGYEFDNDVCDACIAGKFKSTADSDLERGQCLDCISGTYSDVVATVQCKFCGIHMHSVPQRDSIETCRCDPGFAAENQTTCASCPTGKYSYGGTSGKRFGECLDCPVGKTTILQNRTLPDACLCKPGFGTLDNTALAQCTECVDGKYSTGFANIACYDCGFGGITFPEVGATSFDNCQCNHALGLYEE